MRHAGHIAEMSTPDTHKVILKYVYEHGANYLIRLAHMHSVIVTEVGCNQD